MSKVVGMRDILKIPEFRGCREMDLLDYKMDEKVFPYLYEMGIDTEYGVEIVVANYRDLHNKIGIGYRYVGEIRCGRDFINSPWCDITDRITASAYQDASLAKELCTLSSTPYRVVNDEDMEKEGAMPPDQLEPDYKESASLIRQLEDILFSVRGDQRDDSGNIRLGAKKV